MPPRRLATLLVTLGVLLVAAGVLTVALRTGWVVVGDAPPAGGTVVAGAAVTGAPVVDARATAPAVAVASGAPGSALPAAPATPPLAAGAPTGPRPADLHVVLPPLTPTPLLTPDPGAPPTATVDGRRVGIIPGHWQYDTGAVCPDGREEVQVTADVALRVQALLEYRGFTVDLLPEHDPSVPAPPLQGYRGAALVSIHADSCDVPGVSGFKVARWEYSAMRAVEDGLVDCLEREYQAATLLDRHDASISDDMRNYYVFREIGVDTPAAIIELGFLAGDRAVLDDRRYEMALGVANGLSCFLNRR